ncbi:MAG: zinc ribbon-containing protein [Gammaproteobacteria bacterium]|nr:zinc ribbon-containing protein [Gammaproteobacteria bacterium]
MSDKNIPGLDSKLTVAYNLMLERARETMAAAGQGLRHGVDAAMEKATELGELSREEAEEVSEYVLRDLHDAADFINQSGNELRDWLRFDLEVVEQSLADMFAQMVDQTRLELDRLEQRATALGEWHTGEIVGIGTLECKGCGEHLHFHHTGHIPPCPKCHGTKYRRTSARTR